MIRLSRTVGLLVTLLASGLATTLVHCGTSDATDDAASAVGDEVVGVNNRMGLKLIYLDGDKKIYATLPRALPADYKLYVNVRRGKISMNSHDQMRCHQVAPRATVLTPTVLPDGTTVYEGPHVKDEFVKLLDLFNDERWGTGRETPEMNAEVDAGPDPIVEACIVKGDPATGHVLAKLITNLAYAWDRGTDLAEVNGAAEAPEVEALLEGTPVTPQRANGLTLAAMKNGNVNLMAARRRDAGRPTGTAGTLREGRAYNMIDYTKLCMQELGEIPYFKPIKDASGEPTGKYETFDCRDFTGSNTGGADAPIPGVESALIPLSVDDVAQEKCSRGQSSVRSYDCVNQCDRAMYLTASGHTGLGEKASCQPGVTVSSATNDQGSHWVLLCRKVEDTGVGMTKTKRFNDIAMIGTNPKTGRTCFFQNAENIGNDGAHVVHPADIVQSNHIWPSDPPSYCTGSCHTADAFIHSPWIDEAKRGDAAKSIVPKMGELADFSISDNGRPYSLINGKAQGFGFAKQLIGEGVEQCTSCHRVAGPAFSEFADWATGTGDGYYGKITERYKAFEKSHWMPPRLDGLTAETFDNSSWGKAVKHIRKCMDPSSGAQSEFPCEWANIPSKR